MLTKVIMLPSHGLTGASNHPVTAVTGWRCNPFPTAPFSLRPLRSRRAGVLMAPLPQTTARRARITARFPLRESNTITPTAWRRRRLALLRFASISISLGFASSENSILSTFAFSINFPPASAQSFSQVWAAPCFSPNGPINKYLIGFIFFSLSYLGRLIEL
jgi:hypothetical protein